MFGVPYFPSPNEIGGEIRTFDENDILISSYDINNLGDNSFQDVFLNGEAAKSLEVEFVGGAAITDISFERFYKDTATVTIDGYPEVTDSDSTFLSKLKAFYGDGSFTRLLRNQ